MALRFFHRLSVYIAWIAFIFAGTIAHAEAPLPEPYGLAMHGAPLYNAQDTHAGYANPDAPKGGSKKIAEIGSFDTLNPYSIKGNAAKGLNLVYDRLMARMWDEPFTMYPLIAERADVAEDRSEVTFTINAAAKFHDGSAITAHDVLFSFETLRDEGRPNMRRVYRLVETAKILDNQSIHFKFGEGHDRETVMILALMPVLSKAYWQDRTFDQTTLEEPVLNGPYRIKNFEAGRFITYERVKDYWAADLLPNKGHHNFDEITYEYYRDDTIALQSFKKGDLDLRREYDVSKWASDYQEIGPDITLTEASHSRPERVRSFIFNMRRAPFDDVNVRKALFLAFDANWASKNIFHNRLKRIDSYFPNTQLSGATTLTPDMKPILVTWFGHISETTFAQNFSIIPEHLSHREQLREAAKFLNEAGWNVKNGQRFKDGKPLSFELLLTSPEDEKIALHYKKSLERLGVNLNIRTMDSAAFQDRLKAYDFDMVSYYWQNSLSPGTEQLLYWGCEAAKQDARWNFSGICNPAVDHLAAAMANAKDYKTLTTNTRILDRILLSQYMAIPLFYSGVDYIAHKSMMRKPEKTPIYGAALETWWMDQPASPNED